MTLSRRQRVKSAAIAAIGVPVIEALGGTYSWRERGRAHLDALTRAKKPYILALWHGRILSATTYFRDRGVVVMASENFDGDWIARILHKFGYGSARGSTSRGGARALVRLRKDMRGGASTALTVDGPRGPAGVAQPGAIWLASATGYPILPFHIEASSYWTVKSWDRHQVPKPGSTLGIAIGEPMAIAPDLDDAGIEAARVELERTLGRLERQAAALARPAGGHGAGHT